MALLPIPIETAHFLDHHIHEKGKAVHSSFWKLKDCSTDNFNMGMHKQL